MCGQAARAVLNEPRDVHGEVRGEIVGVGFGKARPADDAGVVDQDVDASELRDRGVDERLPRPSTVDTSFVSAIATPPAATISAATARRRSGVGAHAFHRAAEVVDDDTRAAVGEQECMGPADAASRRR